MFLLVSLKTPTYYTKCSESCIKIWLRTCAPLLSSLLFSPKKEDFRNDCCCIVRALFLPNKVDLRYDCCYIVEALFLPNKVDFRNDCCYIVDALFLHNKVDSQ